MVESPTYLFFHILWFLQHLKINLHNLLSLKFSHPHSLLEI